MATGLALITIALLCESLFSPLIDSCYHKVRIATALSNLHQKEKIADEMLEFAKKENPYQHENWFLYKAKKEGIFFYIYSASNLHVSFWTTNSILPKVAPFQDTTIMESLANGYYMQKNTYYKDLIYITLIPVEYNYSIHNNYLQNSFVLNSNSFENFHISLKKEKEGTPFYSNKGLYLFNLQVGKKTHNYYWIGWLFIIGLSCYCMYINGWLVQLISSKRVLKGIALYAISIILPLVVWYIYPYPKSLFEWHLFSPELYASSSILSSLGYLLILSSITCWSFRIFSHLRIATLPKQFRKVFVFIQILALICLSNVIYAVVKSLVSDSKLSLDLGNISEISIYTLGALGAITGFVLAFFILLHCTIKNAFKLLHGRKSMYLFIASAGIIITTISLTLYHFSSVGLVFAFICLLLYTNRYKKTAPDRLIGLAILIAALFITTALSINNAAKTKEIQKVLASTLFSERDAIGEYMFGDVYENIKNDNYLGDYFYYKTPLLSQNILKQRLIQLYLSGYYSKYDMELLSFTPAGTPYKGNYDNSFDFYTGLINTNKAVPARDDSSLYFLNSYNGLPAYLSFIPVIKDGNFLGTLVLLFTQKAFYEESIYPELLLSENLKPLKRLQEYSYAIYVNNYLITQKGACSYDEALKPKFQSKKMYAYISDEGYQHFIYHLSPEQTIIVSDKEDDLLYYTATFSFILFFFIAFLAIIILFRLIFIGVFAKNSKGLNAVISRITVLWRNLSFRAKVLISIISSVTLALFLIGFTTIKYISYHYSEEELLKLNTKTRAIKERLETQLKNDLLLAPQPGEELTSIVKSLSKLYQTDINVYDIDGKLLGYSQPVIYDKKLIQPRMEPEAYFNFIALNKSQLQSEEQIGKLNYIAAYMPLRNYNNHTAGFVSLPYFAKERELDDAISSFLEALINLYLLLFLGLLVISFVISNALTAPLNIIRRHLRATSLTDKNEPIKWENNDEIGKLVKEYNSMVLEISESAHRLAQSEREGAWREMAKQVAHEIKNPLTPMKLNIQQLQRAWKDDPQRLKEMFDRVTTLLITQIDRLSQIATEFSSFAQMPHEQPIKLEINEGLKEAVDLFHSTNEVSLSLFTPNEPVYTYMDAGHFARVMNNLIKNAIQAMLPGKLGVIVISCKKEDHKIVIEVRDNGSGIPEELRDKIFTPNFSTKTSGMGLGLAIIKNIIERAGGTIRFDTKLGEGTSFFIIIPEYHNPKELK